MWWFVDDLCAKEENFEYILWFIFDGAMIHALYLKTGLSLFNLPLACSYMLSPDFSSHQEEGPRTKCARIDATTTLGSRSMKLWKKGHSSKRKREKISAVSFVSDDGDIVEIQASLKANCTCSQFKHSGGCYIAHWGINADVIRRCRKPMEMLDGAELRTRQDELIRRVGESNMAQLEEGKKLSYKYEVEGQRICHNAYLLLHGISEGRFKKFWKESKQKGDPFINAEKTVAIKPEHIPDISFNEMCEVYESNVFEDAGNI